MRQSWTHADVAAFEAAVTAHGKDFELIAAELALLPGKRVPDAVDFFYNAWKTRGLERARLWYARRQQARPRSPTPAPLQQTLGEIRLY